MSDNNQASKDDDGKSTVSDDCIWDPTWVDNYEAAAAEKTKADVVKAFVAVRRKVCGDREPVFPRTVEDFKAELKHRSSSVLVWERKLSDAYLTKRFYPGDVELRWKLGGVGPSGAGGFIFEPIKSEWSGARALEQYVRWLQDVSFRFTPEGPGSWVVMIMFRGDVMNEDIEVEHSEGVVL